MKVLTGSQMMELDRRAQELGLDVLVLMENAGRSVAQAIVERALNPSLSLEGGGRRKRPRVVVVAGKGNNGGDGLVAARHLLNLGAEVKVFILAERGQGQLSPPAERNAAILEKAGAAVEYLPDEAGLANLAAALERADIVVDALLGLGIAGPVRGYYARAIDLINAAGAFVVAVDLPSGLEAETGRVEGPCVRARLTVTMGLPKLGLLLYPGREFVGELVVGEVGYPRGLVEGFDSKLELIDRELVASPLPRRRPYSHKGDYGRIFVLAGSRGYTGAAALAAEAALRAGAGLVTLGIPASLNPILEEKLTEVITRPLPEVDGSLAFAALGEIEESLKPQDVLALGPGLSRHPETARLVKELIKRVGLPAVVDADGLNNLSDEPEAIREAKAPLVLTPHPGELSRLNKKAIAEIEADRVGAARAFAKEYNVILVLKGVPTVVATPDGRCYINSTGNSGLASGGSGDVLTGLIAGFLGQGLEPWQAAVCGVYLHGLTADRLKPETGERAMIAGDLLKKLPQVLKEFE
ncbi:MAG: NAD(P)H-hydrate dehydratase [Candidatus Acetothermia bacterium]|jgi:NAD(P)H-hydrate epimerase|nr:NAD(P)H-hydrate dehydratase [Candidatus Acetothermia bacterium]MDH7505222.1 NAD(P)H-hydrate dehydratase [Candidatus Acetothermia bacterium]